MPRSQPQPVTGENLFRNVPAVHYDKDADDVSPAVFRPTKADNGQLSSDREAVWTAEKSYRFRTKVLAKDSCGVLSIGADELFNDWAVSTVRDPLVKGVDGATVTNPAHALSDFSHVDSKSRTDRARIREAILERVLDKGWAYGPTV